MWIGFSLSVVAAVAANLEVTDLPDLANCPTEREVEEELLRLGAERGARPEITITGNTMRVVLRSQEGTTVGSREVEAPVACHERATVAAVLVATWMGIWPEAANRIERAPPVVKPTVVSSSAPPSQVARSSAEIGLAVEGAHDGNALALGLALSASRALSGGLRAFVAASATTERERGVGPATAGYMRPTLEAGPTLRLGRGGALDRRDQALAVFDSLTLTGLPRARELETLCGELRAHAGRCRDARADLSHVVAVGGADDLSRRAARALAGCP